MNNCYNTIVWEKGADSFLSGEFQDSMEIKKMNHKSILAIIAGLFSVGLLSSILSLSTYTVFYPEFFYVGFFVILVVLCIGFFKRDERMVTKNKRPSYLQVINQKIIIGKRIDFRPRRNLFLRVSIITMFVLSKIK